MSKFKVGDRVRGISPTTQKESYGEPGTVVSVTPKGTVSVFWDRYWACRRGYRPDDLELTVTLYKTGDVIRLTKDDTIIQGPATKAGELGGTLGGFLAIDYYLASGWTLEVIEEAPEPLPKEPGVYEGDNGMPYLLSRSGEWTFGTEFRDEKFMQSFDKLTRLVPEVKP